MKLISWNCQGGFRKKADIILAHKPDILVIQECEHSDKLIFNSIAQKPTDIYWYGDSKHKGIGIFSYSDYRFELMDIFNPEFRYVLPFRVSGYGHSFILFAIWAMDNKENRKARYIGQVWLALNHYASLLDQSTLMIGDFNSNKIWDYKDRFGNHTDVVDLLVNKNIFSTYHKYLTQEQGKESHPTFYLQRNKDKPYHIDYCFTSIDLYKKVNSMEIGAFEDWIAYSDHVPIIINFDL